MNRTKKAIIFIVVGLLILSLILFYFPFALSRSALQQNRVPRSDVGSTQSLPAPEFSESNQETVLTPEEKMPTPDSFSGLEEENQSLEELKELLEGF